MKILDMLFTVSFIISGLFFLRMGIVDIRDKTWKGTDCRFIPVYCVIAGILFIVLGSMPIVWR